MTNSNDVQSNSTIPIAQEVLQRLYREDGTPRVVGVIGQPVAHSLSPAIHNAAFEYYKLPHRYQKWEVASADLKSFFEEVQAQKYLGVNVTVPHKQAVLQYLDSQDEVVSATGAANTILVEQGTLVGYNTDPIGFLEALQNEADFKVQGKRTLVMGAGGAARSVVLALASEGAVEIAVANRTYAHAAELVKQLAPLFPNVHIYAAPLDPAAWPSNRNPRHLIVNTTSMGLLEPSKPFPISAEALSGRDPDRHTIFFDLTYGDTPFLRMVRPVAAHVLDGLSMLVYQGAQSFELWTGLVAPRQVMLEAARQALATQATTEIMDIQG